MSNNLSREARLTAHVLNAPKERPHLTQNYCALYRAHMSLHGTSKPPSMVDAAESLGFSEVEAYGIMDGWDAADGRAAVFDELSARTDYRRGEELGKQLHALVCASQGDVS